MLYSMYETRFGVRVLQAEERVKAVEAPREASANWLALANYCHALLNSAEFSFID